MEKFKTKDIAIVLTLVFLFVISIIQAHFICTNKNNIDILSNAQRVMIENQQYLTDYTQAIYLSHMHLKARVDNSNVASVNHDFIEENTEDKVVVDEIFNIEQEIQKIEQEVSQLINNL